MKELDSLQNHLIARIMLIKDLLIKDLQYKPVFFSIQMYVEYMGLYLNMDMTVTNDQLQSLKNQYACFDNMVETNYTTTCCTSVF